MTDPEETRPEEAPSQEEIYEQLEAEIGKLKVEDVLLQSIVSLLNLSARRIAKEDERDLDQARLGIEAVRALLDLVPPDAAAQVRDALSQVQMLYAREVGGVKSPPESQAGPDEPKGPEPTSSEPPPRIWTPPGSVS